jgi:hypothetical protein
MNKAWSTRVRIYIKQRLLPHNYPRRMSSPQTAECLRALPGVVIDGPAKTNIIVADVAGTGQSANAIAQKAAASINRGRFPSRPVIQIG